MLTAAEKLRLIMKRQNKNMGELADATGQSRQNLPNKFSRNNFSEKEIYDAARALGCSAEIIFTLPDGTQL